jgi:hypothetical protein
MSRHIGRKQRWSQASATRYVSALGEVVYREKAWFGMLRYQTQASRADRGALPDWQDHNRRLGPYKRPRNAMVALEREVTMLQNRHGSELRIGG